MSHGCRSCRDAAPRHLCGPRSGTADLVAEIDPIARTLEVFRLDAQRWTVADSHSGDATVHAVPFDAIALELAVLWAE